MRPPCRGAAGPGNQGLATQGRATEVVVIFDRDTESAAVTDNRMRLVSLSAGAEARARRTYAGRRIQLVAAAAGIAVVAVAVLAATGVLGSRSQPPPAASNSTHQTPSAEPQGDVFGTGVGLSCVETYSPQTLARRAFAFDGTVVSIGEPSSTGHEVADPYVPVTFAVTHWFRGGQGDRVTVAMFPPDAVTSVDNATYAAGSRLLVSGEARFGGAPLDDPIAWACGFTRWYSPADAQTWEQALR
jgi:hypothetical protein